MKKTVLTKGDTYSAHSWCYLTELNRQTTEFSLYSTSYIFFKKIGRVKKIRVLRTINDKLQKNTSGYNFEVDALLQKHLPTDEELLDEIKLILCFENYMKAVLLSKGYLIHVINKSRKRKINSLHKIQNKKRIPVKIEDYIKLETYAYDAKLNKNTLLTLSDRTIAFSTLLNKDYQKIINLPAPVLKIVSEKNERRNQLHFLRGLQTSFGSFVITDTETLISFFNKDLVKGYNKLAQKIEHIKNKGFKAIRIKRRP